MRLSVSSLESLRYFKNSEDATLDKLLRDLAHVDPPTRKMAAGKALAKFFETADHGHRDAAVVDGWRFNFALDAEIELPPIRELKAEMEFATPSGPVTLVGMVDDLSGLTVRDQKLSDRFEVEEKYTDSLQWRAYLVMFGARRFIYDIFVGRVPDDEDVVTITEYHPVTFYAYPNMREDVERAVCELAEIMARYQPEIEALRAGAQKAAA